MKESPERKNDRFNGLAVDLGEEVVDRLESISIGLPIKNKKVEGQFLLQCMAAWINRAHFSKHIVCSKHPKG